MDKQQLISALVNYLKMNQSIQQSDCILVLGSHDLRVAQRAVDLFNQGLAPYITFSGGIGRLSGDFPKPEAEVFADKAIKLGVPKNKIIIENKSTNTGENIKFSLKLLKEKELTPGSFIIVTQPFLGRRAFATFKKLFPDKKASVTAPLLDFENYKHGESTDEDIIKLMLGEIERIKEYPEKGYQIYQEIPEEVWDAYNELNS